MTIALGKSHINIVLKVGCKPDYIFWAMQFRAVVNYSSKDIVYVLEAFDGPASTGVKTAWRRPSDNIFFICFLADIGAEPAEVEPKRLQLGKELGDGQASSKLSKLYTRETRCPCYDELGSLEVERWQDPT